MFIVFKYELEASFCPQELSIPRGAKILSVGAQGEKAYLWALVNADEAPEKRTFLVVGTGYGLEEHPGKFIGTVFMRNGTYILHAFEMES